MELLEEPAASSSHAMKVSMVKVLGSSAPEEGAGVELAVGVASAATEVAAGAEDAGAEEAATEEAAAEVAAGAVGVAVAVPLPAPVVGAGVEEPEPPVQRAGPGML